MISLMVGIVNQNDVQTILGYFLSSVEVFIIVLRILVAIFPNDSKFGKVLARFLKGAYSAKEEARRIKEEKEDDQDAN